MLRRKASRVRGVSAGLRTFVDDMFDTMQANRGSGLAATQVGRPWRVIVADTGAERFALINPEVVRASGAAIVDEGCLSLPNWYGPVERATDVTVKGLGLERQARAPPTARLGRPRDPARDRPPGRGDLHRPPGRSRETALRRSPLTRSARVAGVLAAMRVVFFGTPEFAVPSLHRLASDFEVALVVTRPDRPVGRGGKLTPPPIAAVARDLDLDLFQPPNPNKLEAVEAIASYEPQAVVCVAYGRLLGTLLRRLAPPGILNAHPSLLPAYRGASPIQGALLDGASETGVTLIRLVRALDAGPIVAVERTAIEPHETAADLHARLAEMTADLLLRRLPTWAAGQLEERRAGLGTGNPHPAAGTRRCRTRPPSPRPRPVQPLAGLSALARGTRACGRQRLRADGCGPQRRATGAGSGAHVR